MSDKNNAEDEIKKDKKFTVRLALLIIYILVLLYFYYLCFTLVVLAMEAWDRQSLR